MRCQMEDFNPDLKEKMKKAAKKARQTVLGVLGLLAALVLGFGSFYH